MDIDRVRYFCAFSETGSLVKASEILHLSQPALSKAIRLLEQEVGCKLVEPDGRGLRLTQQGRAFKSVAEPLLAQWLSLPGSITQARREKTIRLGSFEVFTTYFLAHWLRELPASGPALGIEVHELGPGRMEEAVASGAVDFGVTYLPIPRSGVEFTPVTRIRMGVFGVRTFLKTPLAKLPFAVPLQPVQGTPSKVQGLDGWPDHKISRQVRFRVTMMESALALCRQGAAVAYLPEFVVKLHNESVTAKHELVELECPVAKADRLQSVFLIQRTSAEESETARSLAKALRALRSEKFDP